MKKFKKIIAMGCAAVMAISAMSMSAFAANDNAQNEAKEVVQTSTTQNEFGFEVLSEDDIPSLKSRTPWMSKYVTVALNNGETTSTNSTSAFRAEAGDKYVYIRIRSMADNDSTINISIMNIDDGQIKGHKLFVHKGDVLKYTIPDGLYLPSYKVYASTNDSGNIGGAYLDIKTSAEQLEADHIL